MDFYAHRSGGFIYDYYGHVGKPFKVSCVTYWIMKMMKYRVTKVPKGSSIKVVLTQALSNSEISLESLHAEELFKKYCS